jgi:hypothetical protein
MFIAVGAKQGSSSVGAAHHMSLLRSFFETFQCICYERFAPTGLVFVRANLMPNTIAAVLVTACRDQLREPVELKATKKDRK